MIISVSEIVVSQAVQSQQITHDNHYIQQAFMRRWSDDGNGIWSYRILVSHAHIPKWELKIMMPISPRHLLYTQIGSKLPHRFTVSQEQTRSIQRFMIERAYRWIFARKELDWIVEDRPRIVDQSQFNAEQKAWKEWHNEQLKIEMA